MLEWWWGGGVRPRTIYSITSPHQKSQKALKKASIPPLHAHTRTINFAKTVFVVFFNSGVDRSHDFVCPTYNILSSYISSLQRSYPQACCRSATPQCQSAKLMRPQLLRRIALGFIWVYKPAVSTAFCSGRVGPMQRCRPLFCM